MEINKTLKMFFEEKIMFVIVKCTLATTQVVSTMCVSTVCLYWSNIVQYLLAVCTGPIIIVQYLL